MFAERLSAHGGPPVLDSMSRCRPLLERSHAARPTRARLHRVAVGNHFDGMPGRAHDFERQTVSFDARRIPALAFGVTVNFYHASDDRPASSPIRAVARARGNRGRR